MTFWANWKMLKDVKHRQLVAEHGEDRMRFKALKANNILPQAIRDEYAEKMTNMPRYCHPNRILNMLLIAHK